MSETQPQPHPAPSATHGDVTAELRKISQEGEVRSGGDEGVKREKEMNLLISGLFEKVRPSLMRFKGYGISRTARESIVGQAFSKAISLAERGMLNLEDRNHFLNLTRKVIYGLVKDHLKSKAERDTRQLAAARDLKCVAQASQEDVRSMARFEEIFEDLARSDPRAPDVLAARYLEGLSSQEVGDRLGISARTVDRIIEGCSVRLATQIMKKERPGR